MKTNVIVYVGIALMLLASLSFVIAEEPMLISANTADAVDSTAILTDNGLSEEIDAEFEQDVGSWQVNQERIKNWFTFNQEKKAERELKIAQMLLVQARVHARNNNTQAMENALEAHNRIINRVNERFENFKEKVDAKGLREDADKLVGLQRAIEVHEARIEKLGELLENENLSEIQRLAIETRLEQAQNNTAKLAGVQMRKEEAVKLRLMAMTNLTEEEVEQELEDLRESHNMSQVKAQVQEMRQEIKANLEQLKEQRQNRVEALKELAEQTRERARQGNLSGNTNQEETENEGSDSGSDSEDEQGSQAQAGQN